MASTEVEIGDRQEAILRLLDTRMACLLVDRSNAEALRPQLLRLREKLAREPLEATMLDRVEELVLSSRRREEQSGLAEVHSTQFPGQAIDRRPLASELVVRSVAGVAGMLVLADLVLRILG